MTTRPKFLFTNRLRPAFARSTAALILILAASCVAFAATLADYKARIDASREIVDKLLLELENIDPEGARTALATVRQNVPSSERVEWPGGSVETNNSWLTENLAVFDMAKSEDDRVAVLAEMSERLAAISNLIGNSVGAEVPDPTKDAEKQKLNEILTREEYQRPKSEEESLFQRWYKEIMEWLSRSMPSTPATMPGGTDFSGIRLVLQIMIFGAAIAIVGFLLHRMLPVLSRRFGSRRREEREDRVIFGERIADDESSGDLFREAERLAAAGDLRAAIRKGYIALLCDLSDRRIVRLSRHKTNRDYLRDARARQDIYGSVQQLTNTFERNWYGLRAVEPSDWEAFKTGYMEAVSAAGRK